MNNAARRQNAKAGRVNMCMLGDSLPVLRSLRGRPYGSYLAKQKPNPFEFEDSDEP